MSELVGGASGLGWVAVKAVLMFSVAVIGLRLSERRTLAQLGAFDFAVAVAVGAIIGRTSTASSASFATGAVALVTLLVAHQVVSRLRRLPGTEPFVDTPPRVLVADGVVQEREMARAGLTTGDLYAVLRSQGVGSLDGLRYVLYETRGSLSVVRAEDGVGPIVRDGLQMAGYDPPG